MATRQGPLLRAVLLARHHMRRAAGLPLDRKPWWERHNAHEHKAQLSIGANIWLLAVVLPTGVGWVVDQKTKGWHHHHDQLGVRRKRAAEDLAVEAVVNERRAQRGLPPVDLEKYSLRQQVCTAGDGEHAAAIRSKMDALIRQVRTHTPSEVNKERGHTRASSAAAARAVGSAGSVAQRDAPVACCHGE